MNGTGAAVGICERCGSEREEPRELCEVCLAITAEAQRTAARLLDRGVQTLRFEGERPDELELVWRAALTAEFHRQRRARFYDRLPHSAQAAQHGSRIRDHVKGYLLMLGLIGGFWTLMLALVVGFVQILRWIGQVLS